MKKIIILMILAICTFWAFNQANAWEEAWTTVSVYVTEPIPWAWCKIETPAGRDKNWNEIPAIYICSIEKGSEQIVKTLWAIIKYFTYIAGLVWVLFIVANGIMYSMWWAEQSLKDEAKKRIIWTLVWLIVLLLTWPILQIIAPWIYK